MRNMKRKSQEPLDFTQNVLMGPQAPLGSRKCEHHFKLCQTSYGTWGPKERLESVWEKTEEEALQITIADHVPRL